MRDAQLPDGDFLPNEVDIKLDMLGLSVMNGVVRHVDGGDVVKERHGHRGNLVEEFTKDVEARSNRIQRWRWRGTRPRCLTSVSWFGVWRTTIRGSSQGTHRSPM